MSGGDRQKRRGCQVITSNLIKAKLIKLILAKSDRMENNFVLETTKRQRVYCRKAASFLFDQRSSLKQTDDFFEGLKRAKSHKLRSTVAEI